MQGLCLSTTGYDLGRNTGDASAQFPVRIWSRNQPSRPTLRGPLLEITSKSRQNQDKCLGTSRQWVQRKNIYFAAKKQQVSLGFLLVSLGFSWFSLGFSWFCLDFKVISSSGGGGRGGTRRGAGEWTGGTRECAVEILLHIHVEDFITYPWTPRTHFLDFI